MPEMCSANPDRWLGIPDYRTLRNKQVKKVESEKANY